MFYCALLQNKFLSWHNVCSPLIFCCFYLKTVLQRSLIHGLTPLLAASVRERHWRPQYSENVHIFYSGETKICDKKAKHLPQINILVPWRRRTRRTLTPNETVILWRVVQESEKYINVQGKKTQRQTVAGCLINCVLFVCLRVCMCVCDLSRITHFNWI